MDPHLPPSAGNIKVCGSFLNLIWRWRSRNHLSQLFSQSHQEFGHPCVPVWFHVNTKYFYYAPLVKYPQKTYNARSSHMLKHTQWYYPRPEMFLFLFLSVILIHHDECEDNFIVLFNCRLCEGRQWCLKQRIPPFSTNGHLGALQLLFPAL